MGWSSNLIRTSIRLIFQFATQTALISCQVTEIPSKPAVRYCCRVHSMSVENRIVYPRNFCSNLAVVITAICKSRQNNRVIHGIRYTCPVNFEQIQTYNFKYWKPTEWYFFFNKYFFKLQVNKNVSNKFCSNFVSHKYY